jgi:predicted transcriptional regulator
LRYNILTMGITKTDIFNEQQNRLALLFKALANPARIAILQHIIRQNACICNDLVGELGLAQATISQHLKELKSIGIIKGSIEGTSVCYCINEEVWQQIGAELSVFFVESVKTGKCC